MYLNRIHHPANFVFAKEADPSACLITLGEERISLVVDEVGADVYRLTARSPRWDDHQSTALLSSHLNGEQRYRMAYDINATVSLAHRQSGGELLAGVPSATIGVCGTAWILQFRHSPGMQFYGLGEHCKGFEKSGQRVKFWNTDLMGDFPLCEVAEGYPNPMYASIPWLIIKQGNEYAGILVNNPDAVFMDLASNFIWNEHNKEDVDRRSFYVGAPRGNPEVYFIAGPSLAELTRKLQLLVGVTPLPPLWALGHHQCRWGYAGPQDLLRLDKEFRTRGIPCDGLWLDIDYMEKYKVFTFNKRLWGTKSGTRKMISALGRKGRRIVPILDPGVKAERGFPVCDSGRRSGIFCVGPTGEPFAGFVWPGLTYFPDFSLIEARKWWSEHVRRLASLGVSGVWIDMNDPAVGAVEIEDMRFAHGSLPHSSFHNQYALGMARATREGMLAARGNIRPFVLSRSAYISTSRVAAVWLGDNYSNWHHLRMSIPMSLGLALSGIPFNGSDIGGFMKDTTPSLLVAWYKAGFLLPFFRNHSSLGTRLQEPWAFGIKTERIIAHYIRLRYRLLPYIYQLFIKHESSGEAIQRPLMYDFDDSPELPLGKIDDQFMVGPYLMQAPFVRSGQKRRTVVLPSGTTWWSAMEGTWRRGGRSIGVRARLAETPIFVREGAVIPMQGGERTNNSNDLTKVELHCFFRPGSKVTTQFDYVADDGESLAYKECQRTSVQITFGCLGSDSLEVSVDKITIGYKPLRLRFVVYAGFSTVIIRLNGTIRELSLRLARWQFSGSLLAARVTQEIRVG